MLDKSNEYNFEDRVTEVVSKVREGVVMVTSHRYQMGRYGELKPMDGAASGIIVSSSGYIVTNHHVIQDHQGLQVTTSAGDVFDASVIGSDPATDVAVLKINARGLNPLKLGDSDKVAAGKLVVAIGNALGLPGDPTVSLGVISAIGRPMPWADFIFEGLLQTDAAINPGNSGGPLATLDGDVVGMNTAIVAFAQGVGFAIPSDTIRRVMEQILDHGRVIRPWIGISGVTVNESMKSMGHFREASGVAIVRVSAGSPAHYAGLKPWDVIVSIDGKKVVNMRGLLEKLSSSRIGGTINLEVQRNGRILLTPIELIEMPEHYLEQRK